MPFAAAGFIRLQEEDGGTGGAPSRAVRDLVAQLSTADLVALLSELRSGRHDASTYLAQLAALIVEELEAREA